MLQPAALMSQSFKHGTKISLIAVHHTFNFKRKVDTMTEQETLLLRQEAPLLHATDITKQSVRDVSGAMNALLADVFALYLKVKNFHWHMSGPHFRDYHLMLDEHGEQLLGMTDAIAERVRKIGATTIRSIGQIAKLQRISDNDAGFVTPEDMLSELHEDEKALVLAMKATHSLCDDADDIATASLLENWIDESERRSWFLFEATRR